MKKHLYKLYEDQRLTEPKSRFKVTVFYPTLDTILSQVDNRFKNMKAVINTYRVVQPYFLVTSTEVELLDEADLYKDFQITYVCMYHYCFSHS